MNDSRNATVECRRFRKVRWTVEDWKDFYRTIAAFKARVVQRATASPYDVSGNPTKEYPGE